MRQYGIWISFEKPEAGQRTDTPLTDLSTDRPTDQRNLITNDNGIRPKKFCNGTIRSLASVKSFQCTFFTDFVHFFLGICQRLAP